jgi:peptide chain release factor subunit 1
MHGTIRALDLSMTMVLPFDLKSLAQHFDPTGSPTYLSLYADLSDQRHEDDLRRRHREIRAALADSAARTRADVLVERALAGSERMKSLSGARGIAVFVGPDGFTEEHALQVSVPTRLVLDASPYMAPLARHADDNESFAVVLMDSEHAAIFVIWAGKAELHKELQTSLIGRHRHGGMSQMRFQRHRRGQVNQFYDYVIDHLAIILSTEGVLRIAVAGPGRAKRDFASRLPKAMQANVAIILDVDFTTGPANDVLVRRFMALMRDEEAKESIKWVEALQRELAVGELAITGALECAKNAAAGRVERLLVLGATTASGSKCEQHQVVFPRGGACHCGSAGAEVDLINEAVEFTARTDGESEFIEPPNLVLSEAGGVAAILRW